MSLSDRWNRCPKHIQLLLILMTTVVIGWIRFQGISLEGDPIAYAKLAFLDAQGLPPWAEWTFTSRIGFTKPISFGISMAGIHLWSFIIWPFICLLLLVLTLWWKLQGNLQFYVVLLVLICPWPATLGMQLLPDLPMMAFAAMSLALLPHFPPAVSRKSWLTGAGFTIALLISGLCKLTVLYLLPFLAILMMMDLVQKRHRMFWFSAISSALLVLGLYWFWGIQEGEFLGRIAQIEQDHNASPFSYRWQNSPEMLSRLFIEPFVSFLGNPGVGILLFPAAAALFSGHRSLKPVLIIFLYLLGIHWLGSTSFSHYSPLPADPRMWILLAIPLILLAGMGLERKSTEYKISNIERGVWWGMMIGFGLLAWLVPLPGVVFILLAGLIFIPIPRLRKWAAPAFICFLLLWAGYNGLNKDNRYYQHQELQVLQTHAHDSAVIYGDAILGFSSFLYESEGIPPITAWPDSLPESHESNNVFFLWNGFRTEQANLYEDRIVPPPYFDDIRSSWELVGQIDAFDIRLYQYPSQNK